MLDTDEEDTGGSGAAGESGRDLLPG